MFIINTQLQYFKYTADSYPFHVNITWRRLDSSSMRAYAFTLQEANCFLKFIKRHTFNFPSRTFMQETNISYAALPLKYSLKHPVPLHIILSEKSFDMMCPVGTIMNAVLTQADFLTPFAFDLDFEVVGKIEIYKKIKR